MIQKVNMNIEYINMTKASLLRNKRLPNIMSTGVY